MACLGGTIEEPRRWVRYRDGERTGEGEGRWCKRTAPWTTTAGERFAGAWNCSSCVLYRGNSLWNGKRTGLDADDQPYALSHDEAVEYEAAVEATYEDDWRPLVRFIRKLNGEAYGFRHLRLIGDPDASEEWATWMRQYRAKRQEYRDRDNARRRAARQTNIERERAAGRERMRLLRARRKGA